MSAGQSPFLLGARTYQPEPATGARLDHVGDDRLEGSKERAKQGQDETPSGEVVCAIGPVRPIGWPISADPRSGPSRTTHAKPTPAITGSKLTSFRLLHLARKKMVVRKMVKRGVEARTTWWNWRIRKLSAASLATSRWCTHWHADEMETEVANGNVDRVEDREGAHDHVVFRREMRRDLPIRIVRQGCRSTVAVRTNIPRCSAT